MKNQLNSSDQIYLKLNDNLIKAQDTYNKNLKEIEEYIDNYNLICKI